MTTALYRRYRPDTFAEVIGQEHVTAPLSAAIERDRVNHAYLFSGPRGCGKTTSARILARCLNCEEGPTSTPCGACDSCLGLARGGPGSLDVIEIDAASHRGIDDAREIRDRAAFAPASSRFKIFIIDEAHMVTKEGFNALLKTVEEPPPHVKFIFATTEPDKVIGTIRSRTHHYPFRLVPPGVLQSYLATLCDREGIGAAPGVLPLVVRAGGGSVRDSLSVLDQLMAGSGDEGVTYPLAIALLGYTDGELLDSVVEALAAGDGATVFRMVDRVIESGHDPRRFVEDLLERLRDLLVVAAVPEDTQAVLRGTPDDQLERMRLQTSAFGKAELSRAADVTNAALTDMTGATSPRLQLELLCARLLLPGAEAGERGLGARMDRLEKRISLAPSQPAAPVSRVSAAVPAAPVNPTAAVTPTPAVTSLAPAASGAAAPPVAPGASAGPGTSALPAVGADSAASQGQGAQEGRPAEAGRPSPQGEAAQVSGPAQIAGGAVNVEALRAAWPDVLEHLSRLKRATWSLVSQHAQVATVDSNRLVLRFSSPGLATTFGRGAHQEFLRQALISTLGLDVAVEAIGGETSGAAQTGASAPVAGPDQGPGGSAPRGSSGPVARPALTPAPGARATSEVSRGSAADPGVDPWAAQPDPGGAGPASGGAGPASGGAGPASGGAGPAPGVARGAQGGSRPEAAGTSRPRTSSMAEQARAGGRPEVRPMRPGTRPEGRGAAETQAPPRLHLVGPDESLPLPDEPPDEPSRDDMDIEDSHLVGAPVVAKLLGGRVIEERDE